MMWMNRFDIDDAYRYYDQRSEKFPNYCVAAMILDNLMGWTDDNSDGWPYWQKPSRAAKRLMEHLEGWRKRHVSGDDADLTLDDLDAALRPVKSFLTRTARDNAERYPDHAQSALNLRASIVNQRKWLDT